MEAVVLLILMFTCIAANTGNTGPSDVLKEAWSQRYLLLRQHHLTRCVRSCDEGAVNVYWKALWGPDIEILTESNFLKMLTDAFTNNNDDFVNSLRKNTTLGAEYLDYNQNGFISKEEYYTEYLCIGFDLDKIKKAFEIHHHGDDGIPVSDFIAEWVEYADDVDEANEMYRLFEEAKNDLNNTK